MQKQRRKRKEILNEMTHELILDAALHILHEEEIAGLTMDRVAQGAGVAKGTLYLHFRDKGKLLEEALEKSFNPFFSQATALLDGDLSPMEKLEELTLVGSRFFEEQRQLLIYVMHSREIKKKHHLEENSPYWILADKVSGVLTEGIRQGIFKPMDTAKVAGMFMDSHGSLLLHRLLGKSAGTAQDDVKLLMDVFLNGILTH